MGVPGNRQAICHQAITNRQPGGTGNQGPPAHSIIAKVAVLVPLFWKPENHKFVNLHKGVCAFLNAHYVRKNGPDRRAPMLPQNNPIYTNVNRGGWVSRPDGVGARCAPAGKRGCQKMLRPFKACSLRGSKRQLCRGRGRSCRLPAAGRALYQRGMLVFTSGAARFLRLPLVVLPGAPAAFRL